jgi:predicted helicase
LEKKINIHQSEYEKGFKIDELYDLNGVGICSKRDETVFHNSEKELISVLNDFKNLSEQEIKQRYKTESKESRDKKTIYAKNNITNFGINKSFLQQITYRPFETKWTYFTNKSKGFLAYPVYEIMQHFINEQENVGLIVSKINRQLSTGYMFITNKITDLHILDTKGDSTYIFPLYTYPEGFHAKTEKRKHNFNKTIVDEISKRIKLSFTEEKEETENTFAPIDILDYIYAVLHSPTYREKYKECLKIDFPCLPYPENTEKFLALAILGKKLRSLHLLENVEPQQSIANYQIQGSNEIGKIQYENGRVWINNEQYFDNVPQEVWEFYIGGYQPAQKWLKEHKGLILRYDDRRHYQRIIRILKETGEIMKEIDKIIGNL